MEGVPTQKHEAMENVENLTDWRESKGRAPEIAEGLIANIDGYEAMAPTEQVAALKETLGGLMADNDNRFVAEAIAHRISFIEEERRHEDRLAQLGVAA